MAINKNICIKCFTESIIFLQLTLLQKKLLAELPEDAMIVAGRFPFPDWTPCRIEGDSVDRAWAYHVQVLRKHHLSSKDSSSPEQTS